MTFDEVGKIICSYGFYSYYNGSNENGFAKYYKYPGIDRLALYTENLCEHSYTSLKTWYLPVRIYVKFV